MPTIKSLIFLSFVLLISLQAQDTGIDPALEEVWCAVALFPAVCPDIYEPVCVDAPKQCFTTPCYQTDEISNGCEACKTEGVQRYTPGKCQYTCDAGNLPPPALDTQDNPVCASYIENCQDSSCRTTFNRATVACQDPDVVTFSLGACDDDGQGDGSEECTLEEEDWNDDECNEEDDWNDDECTEEDDWNDEECSEEEFNFGNGNDNVEYCTGERPEICTMIYAPVCVVECANGDCRQTAASACTACSDPNVLGYIQGPCEPEKIQCPVLDLSATDIACTMEYAPVCGYSNDCTDAACGVTAGNACEACSFQGKDYYTQGACEDNWNGPV